MRRTGRWITPSCGLPSVPLRGEQRPARFGVRLAAAGIGPEGIGLGHLEGQNRLGRAQLPIRRQDRRPAAAHPPSSETVHKYGTNPPDTHQAIEWDGHSVHGCSIYVPTKTWTETVEIPTCDYSFDYEDQVEALMESPSTGVVSGQAQGIGAFLGMNASVSTQNPDFVQAAFDFSYSPNF